MKENINIDNYEAYYLDFLEGNLNSDDEDCLLKFLEQNPQLKLDDENLSFNISNYSLPEQLSNSFKSSLKSFDENEEITTISIEKFIIAYYENCLSPIQEKNLFDFLESNPNFQKTFSLYKNIKFYPENIVYPNKSLLKIKNKSKFLSFYYVSASIAALMILFLLTYPFNEQNKNETLLSNNIKTKNVQNSYNNSTKNLIDKESLNNEIVKNKNSKSKNNYKLNNNIKTYQADNKIDILKANSLEIQSLENIKTLIITEDLNNNNSNFKYEKVATTFLSINEMDEPLKFITKPINDKLNSNLEFRTAKVKKDKQGGFYFRIGSFEISKKKSPTQEDLALEL